MSTNMQTVHFRTVAARGFDLAGFVILDPSPGDLLLTVQGPFAASPQVVLCQARQSVNENLGYPDQFAIQVIATTAKTILLRVRRLDVPGGGWGQHLRIDIGVIN